MPLFGQDPVFYDLLEKQARIAQQGAQEMAVLCQDFTCRVERAEKLKQLESEADDVTHELANRADQKFITPFDKEDLHAMSVALDDLIDHMESTASRIVIYRLEAPRPDFAELGQLLQQGTRTATEAVSGLRHLKNHEAMHEALVRVHELENRSDHIYRQALDRLFNEGTPDPLTVIKWKEIYDRMEASMDKCEDLAVTLESVMIKYG